MKKLWNRDFILLLQASAVSTLGDLIYSIAIGYWVYEKTGSSALMGVMSSISMFVTMILSPFCGSIVDRSNRKWVLVGMDLMQCAVMVTVGVLAYTDRLGIPGVLAAAFLAALGSVFYSPASSTLMIDIIPHEHMVRGQSLFSGTSSLINMVGSAFSGVLVAFFGVPLIVIFNGLTNLYSAVSELFICVPKTAKQGTPVSLGGILKDSRSALSVIFSDRYLKLFIPCMLILNLLGAGPLALMLPFAMEKGFAVEHYGYLMSIWTVACLVCAVLLGAVKLKPRQRFWVMAIGFCGMVVFLILAYQSKSLVGLCIFAFLGAFANTAGNTVFGASMMLALPEENRGAILGLIQSASVGGSAISTVLCGVLGDIFPLYLVFTVGALLSVIPMLYLCASRRTKEFILTH